MVKICEHSPFNTVVPFYVYINVDRANHITFWNISVIMIYVPVYLFPHETICVHAAEHSKWSAVTLWFLYLALFASFISQKGNLLKVYSVIPLRWSISIAACHLKGMSLSLSFSVSFSLYFSVLLSLHKNVSICGPGF